MGHPREVGHPVEAPELLQGLRKDRLHRFRVGYVGHHGDGLGPRAATASARSLSSRSTATRLAPSRAKRSKAARPMPLAAPVTRMVFPESLPISAG